MFFFLIIKKGIFFKKKQKIKNKSNKKVYSIIMLINMHIICVERNSFEIDLSLIPNEKENHDIVLYTVVVVLY